MRAAAAMTEMAREILDSVDVVAVDVGAARGLLPHWEPLASLAKLVLFEPDEAALPLIRERLTALGARNFVLMPFGLSETGGTKTLHQIAIRSSSSLLPANLPDVLDYSHSEWIFPQSEIEIETRRLGDVLDEARVGRVDMIKLDTQGTELAILRGLGERAKGLLSLETEVATADGYVGATKLSDLLAFAEANDLELFDLATKRSTMVHAGQSGFYERLFGTYRRSPALGTRLIEVDALFMRKRSSVLASGDPAEVRRATAVLALHGRYSHAHRTAELATDQKILTEQQFRSIERALVAGQRKAFVRRVALDVADKLIEKVGYRLSILRP